VKASEWETVGRSLYCGFWGEGWTRQSKQAWDWLVWIIVVSSEAWQLFLGVWYLSMGDKGRPTVAQGVRPDKGSGWGYGLWIGWLAVETHIGKQLVYYL
jgi:hypothetical protein